MPATLIHLVRHGEVHNPDRVLYGRLPGFGLSDLGHRMAERAAAHLQGRTIVKLYASPLQRTQESAKPWSDRFGLEITTDERLIEPHNKFEGRRASFGPGLLTQPETWPWMSNPRRPSWGEPFVDIAARMLSVVHDAWSSVDDGEVVLVTHQLPIWMVHRSVNGKKLYHDPRRRRCSLSSITTLEYRESAPTSFAEIDYQDPAADLLAESVDLGAV
ncbi:broad specificity phosphatase PhoE [Diaminobutyricimonas aerilata]|uniref:Broad specificity phosphatase PhoE n=1 Tax=Diaminobutyricimonas aerilata TaxID=1162967 RepID=A0A2M9CG96_9MICO|nr:histidine phosphatase family protein [Diaminobutyricimonas aerilata]PJJ70909.1 broad specificity phosphatase PhoE [Diaminobutyricimonas aerilata]